MIKLSEAFIREDDEEELAHEHDKKTGYSIRITRYNHEKHAPEDKDPWVKKARKGTMHVTNHKGHTVRGGYWMDWPEKGEEKDYHKKPEKERAAGEARRQITHYGGLKHFHAYHSFRHAHETLGKDHLETKRLKKISDQTEPKK